MIILFFIQMPYFFAVIPFLLWIAPYVRTASFLILGVCVLILNGSLKKLFRNELLLWGCVGWSIVLCISMHLNGKGVSEILKNPILFCWIMVLLFSVYSKVNLRKFLFLLFLYYLVINTLNNASVMFFCNSGIWIGPFGDSNPEYIFFGHINEGITCGLNSILFGCICSRQYEKRWEIVNWVNILYSLCSALVIDCVVQILTYGVAALALLICYLCQRFPGAWKVFRWINLKTIMIFNLLITDAVVVLGRTGWMEKLGIDAMVHGRRELWDSVLTSIIDHPVIGQGYIGWFNVLMHYDSVKTFWHQHSIYLMVLYETGIIGATFFVFMFVIGIISVGRIRKQSVRFLIGVLVGVFFLAMVVEICVRTELFLLLAVCYYLAGAISAEESRKAG